MDFNRLCIIGEIVDYFARLRMVPRPESALPIFLGLEGEAALSEIITREFGPTARFRHNFDPNSPEAGMILTPSVAGAFNIVAVVLDVD